jgi:hypothetical protein
MSEGKSMFRRLLLLGVLISSIGGTFHVQPAAAHSGYWRNTGNTLNLREGPGGSYAVIGKVPANAVVKAYGHRSNWLKLKVLSTGQIGWAWLWNFHASSYVPPAPAPPPSSGDGSGLPRCYPNTWGQTFCAADWIAQTAYAAAQYWGASYWWLMSIASCESNFDPGAYNPATGVSGIMQFLPSTMEWISPGASPWSVSDSMYTAAHMYVLGMQSAWDCNHRI